MHGGGSRRSAHAKQSRTWIRIVDNGLLSGSMADGGALDLSFLVLVVVEPDSELRRWDFLLLLLLLLPWKGLVLGLVVALAAAAAGSTAAGARLSTAQTRFANLAAVGDVVSSFCISLYVFMGCMYVCMYDVEIHTYLGGSSSRDVWCGRGQR
jgi:hypothetical protein